MSYFTVGIDPGLDGGLAVYSPESETTSGGSPRLVLTAMPTLSAGKGKREVDVAGVRTFLVGNTHGLGSIRLAVLERVGALRRSGGKPQGTVSMFTFGTCYGELRGILKWENIPFLLPRSQDWKAVLLQGTAKDKGAAIQAMRHRFPEASLRRTTACRTDHDGMAEAGLLALYGYHKLQGGK